MSKSVTVYKINEKYFPDGCQRNISCGMFSSIATGVTLELPAISPQTCELEGVPDPVLTEILIMDNGEKWWIGYDGVSLAEKCATGQVDVDEDGELVVPAGLIMALGLEAVGADDVANIGTTPGGNELVNGVALVNGVESIQTIGYKAVGPTTLYLSGNTVPIKIYIYKI